MEIDQHFKRNFQCYKSHTYYIWIVFIYTAFEKANTIHVYNLCIHFQRGFLFRLRGWIFRMDSVSRASAAQKTHRYKSENCFGKRNTDERKAETWSLNISGSSLIPGRIRIQLCQTKTERRKKKYTNKKQTRDYKEASWSFMREPTINFQQRRISE